MSLKLTQFCGQTQHKLFAVERPLTDRNTNFRLIINSRGSTNPTNLTKIGLVDFEIGLIGLTEIVKNVSKIKKKIRNSSKKYIPLAC